MAKKESKKKTKKNDVDESIEETNDEEKNEDEELAKAKEIEEKEEKEAEDVVDEENKKDEEDKEEEEEVEEVVEEKNEKEEEIDKEKKTGKKTVELTVSSAEPEKLKDELEKISKLEGHALPMIKVVDHLIKYAFLVRASDIHFEPYEDKIAIRMRVDGILYDYFNFSKDAQSGMVTRIKVLAGMRTDEHRAAQDGRFRVEIKEPARTFDIRVSVIPAYYGEKAVLRLLAEQEDIESLDSLALDPVDRKKIDKAVRKPFGMILATGPTGSGKTTTLYTILKELNTREISIITVEDPIEYSIDGVDQIQVNSETGLTFANGLRSILRQDPDVIMVGEIRDDETAAIAINAALTGHKMLSTLHTNDAATTLPRLLDMKIEPFLIASTVNIAIGQRLLRKLCKKCVVKKEISAVEFKVLSEFIPSELLGNNKTFYFPGECEDCSSGYKGRMGVYEVLEINDEIREAIMRRADAGEIKKIAVKAGMTTMTEDAFKKALNGLTSIEEVVKIVHEA